MNDGARTMNMDYSIQCETIIDIIGKEALRELKAHACRIV